MEKKLKGFTIIELLVVLTIITVLCSIGIPAALTWVRDARIRDANEEARLIYSAVQDRLTELEIKNIGIDNVEFINSVSDNEITASVPAGYECVYGKFDHSTDSTDVYNFSDALGENFEGVWCVKINNETYTVERAWWVEIPNGGNITLTSAAPITTPYTTLTEQETACRRSGVTIGQFPI